MGERITLTAEDGHKFSAYRANPAGPPRGGLVVIQEIFGVNGHIRRVTDGFVADGWVALAPALFDRVEPSYETGYTQDDVGETDASIPKEHYEKVKQLHPTIPVHVYPAGHGFNCDERGSYHEPSARLARERTVEFLRRHLG